jgi:hypothetical protein
VVAIVILHDTGVANFSIGTSSGVDMNAAIGLLHDDSEDEAAVDTTDIRGVEDGILEAVDLFRCIVDELESTFARLVKRLLVDCPSANVKSRLSDWVVERTTRRKTSNR